MKLHFNSNVATVMSELSAAESWTLWKLLNSLTANNTSVATLDTSKATPSTKVKVSKATKSLVTKGLITKTGTGVYRINREVLEVSE